MKLLWHVAGGAVSPASSEIATLLGVATPAAAEVREHLQTAMRAMGFVPLRRLVELDARPFDLGGVHVLLLVAAERRARGAIAVRRVPDLSSETVRGFLSRRVRRNTTIFTDCWSGYVALDDLALSHEPGPSPAARLSYVDAAHRELMTRASDLDGPEALDRAIERHTFARNRIRRYRRGEVLAWLLLGLLGIDCPRRRRSGVRRKAG